MRDLIPGAGPRPIQSRDDVVSRLPKSLQQKSDLGLISALVDCLTEMLNEFQYRTDLAAAAVDELRAVQQFLRAIAMERITPGADGEDDEALRARILYPQAAVDEASIVAGVNAILAPFTTTTATLIDAQLDQWFVGDGSTDWHSYVGAGPDYLDRHYPEHADVNDGYSVSYREPGGARAFSDALGRHFHLILPNLLGIDLTHPYVFDGAREDLTTGFYIGDGSNSDVAGYVNETSGTGLAVYAAIERFVSSVAGQSVRFTITSED